VTAAVRRGMPAALVGGAFVVLGAGIALQHAKAGIPLAILLLALAGWITHPVLSWNSALTTLLLVILFIPIRRYTLPVKLVFQLEPYRIAVFVLVVVWGFALLVDQRVTSRRSGFEAPLGMIAFAALASVATNIGRVAPLQTDVLKSLTFFASFFCLFYVVVSLVRTIPEVERVLRVLVGGGAVIAFLAIIETRTGFDPFNHLSRVMPFLVQREDATLARGIHHRAFGPAEHPIALSAALVLLVPPALALGLSERRKVWWVAVGTLIVGALATLSRTGLLMLLVEALVFIRLRPREAKRMWPLAVLLVVATHFAAPGTLGTLQAAVFKPNSVVPHHPDQAKQDACRSGGRLANLGPALSRDSQKPLFGYGYGTLITTGLHPNACFLDDQWLTTLSEDGAVAVLGWLWLFFRAGRRLGRASREDETDRGWLLVALCASLTGCAAAMLTFDAFSFVQVALLLFILLALASVVLATPIAAARPSPRAAT
jgi:polysaccharide biosynthesis protein PslJ